MPEVAVCIVGEDYFFQREKELQKYVKEEREREEGIRCGMEVMVD